MCSLYEKLNKELKKAMLEKDKNVCDIVRGLKAKLQEYQVAHKLDRSVNPQDEVVLTVLQSHKKSLEKAIEQFGESDRTKNLIEEYNKEIAFCETYLPKAEEQAAKISAMYNEALEVLNIDIKLLDKMTGKITGYIMKNNSGLDGKLVKEFILNKIKDQ